MKKTLTRNSNIHKSKGILLTDMMPNELKDESMRIRLEISKLRVEKVLGKDKNSRKIFLLRKKLAKVLTQLTKKAIIGK
jgi:ribosomal protein L29